MTIRYVKKKNTTLGFVYEKTFRNFYIKKRCMSCLVDVHVAILHTHSAALRFYIILLSYLNSAFCCSLHHAPWYYRFEYFTRWLTELYTASKYFIVGRKFTVTPHIHNRTQFLNQNLGEKKIVWNVFDCSVCFRPDTYRVQF